MSTTNNKQKVRFTPLTKYDFPAIVSENGDRLESSYVILNRKSREVLVKDGSPADLKFREGPAGSCVPAGVVTVGSVLYRRYQVGESVL